MQSVLKHGQVPAAQAQHELQLDTTWADEHRNPAIGPWHYIIFRAIAVCMTRSVIARMTQFHFQRPTQRPMQLILRRLTGIFFQNGVGLDKPIESCVTRTNGVSDLSHGNRLGQKKLNLFKLII